MDGKLIETGTLNGEISLFGKLSCSLSENALVGTLGISSQLSCSLSASYLTGELTLSNQISSFDGDYTITPKAHSEQELECQGFVMRENVLVLKVPYWETSNLQDGLTVYIAEDSSNG